MKKALLILLLLVLIVGLWFVVQENPKPSLEGPEKTTTLEKNQGSIENENTASTIVPESNTKKTKAIGRKTIKPVTPSQQIYENAIAGDFDEAVAFQKKITECQNFKFLLEDAKKKEEFIKSGGMDAATEEFIADGLMSRIAQNTKKGCEKFYAQMGEGEVDTEQINLNILNQLIKEAENDNPMGRLLYALWGPTDRQSLLIGTALIDYERQAMEYTLMNKAGHPELALYALGVSYADEGYFTPQHLSLAGAYFIAARRCGLSSQAVDLQMSVNNVMRLGIMSGTLESAIGSAQDLDIPAQKIAEEFCPDYLQDHTPGLR